jgi:7-carboxy-7-deazaguanine synthase
MYSVKEIFYTLQGEGAMAGRASVFCRFSGCNLWSGREQDRSSAVCQFCDTDFVGVNGNNGGKYTAIQLANIIQNLWQNNSIDNIMQNKPYVVLTGGEPLLQVDEELTRALHNNGFEIAIETNGTQEMIKGIDWVCVSPKFGSKLILTKGNELKIVYPQQFTLDDYIYFASLDFDHFYIQAKDDVNNCALKNENIKKAIQFCKTYSQWQLSIQTHKYLGIE